MSKPRKASGSPVVSEAAPGEGSGRRLELMPLAAVTGAEKNPKKHAHEDIGKSIGRFGYVEPVVLDERTQRLVAGHGRVQALRAAKVKGEAPPQGVEVNDKGEWLVPVLRGWASRSDTEAQAYLVASNSLTTKGGWENAQLAELLQSLAQQQALDGTGFDEAAIDEVLAQASAGVEADEAALPELPAGDRATLQQMTFTLSEVQVALVKQALEAADGTPDGTGNENSNGNALANVCRAFVGAES